MLILPSRLRYPTSSVVVIAARLLCVDSPPSSHSYAIIYANCWPRRKTLAAGRWKMAAIRLAADGCSRRTSRMRSFCSSRVIVVTEDIAGRVAGASKSVWRGSTSRRVLSLSLIHI